LSAGSPSLLAADVDFRKAENPATKLLILDPKIRDLSRTSPWLESLKETMSASELDEAVGRAEKTEVSLIRGDAPSGDLPPADLLAELPGPALETV
jgi:hypothetical protein